MPPFNAKTYIARKTAILRAAVTVAARPGGWTKLTRQAIASEATCSESLVSHYLGSIPAIRRAVIKVAIREGLTIVLVQSIAAHDGYVKKRWLPAALRSLVSP